VELGPESTLSDMVPACLTRRGPEPAVLPLLRRDRAEADTALLSAGALYADGSGMDQVKLWAGRGARLAPLPPYAFHRKRYWTDVDVRAIQGAGGTAAVGLDATAHPLVGGAITLAESGSVVLTGRISAGTHPWLNDHTVGGTVLFPGAGFVELATRAGDEAGCRGLAELVIEVPLALPARGKIQLQVVVEPPDGNGARPTVIYSRPDGDQQPWTRHAAGLLTSGGAAEPAGLGEWPPPGAEPVPVDGLYSGLAANGLEYGPAFRGLHAAWRRGGEVFAEVSVAEPLAAQAGQYGLHPVLLDAALHALALFDSGDVTPGLPFSWTSFELYAAGATRVRVRLRAAGDGSVSLLLADQAGQPVASVGSLRLRDPGAAMPGPADQASPDSAPHELRAPLPAARRSATGLRQDPGTLRRTLAGLDAVQRERELLRLVRDHAAALLGFADGTPIEPDRHFLEAGFDSLTAVELRNRLVAATGLQLPVTVIFDHETPASLAASLADEVRTAVEDTTSPLADSAGSAADTVAQPLGELFNEAVRSGKLGDGLTILSAAANLRPTFGSPADLPAPLTPVQLADGPNSPHLFCFATPAVTGGAYQYARFAVPFRGVRGLSVLPMPGFAAGEPLPDSAAAAVDVLADSVRRAAGGRPFALLGYSSSGILAHAAASLLEKSGDRPEALILLDTYAVSAEQTAGSAPQREDDEFIASGVMADMTAMMLERVSADMPADATKLTAMARYMLLLPEVEVVPIGAPSVLVRPEDRFGQVRPEEGANEWRTAWDRADTVLTVPGNHFSLMEEGAETTARAVLGWLGS
jgi:thioesterase domain-containing protein